MPFLDTLVSGVLLVLVGLRGLRIEALPHLGLGG